MRFAISRTLCAAIVVCLLTVAAWAQQPVPPISRAPANANVPDTNVVVPDDHPLSGAISQGLGTWGEQHSFYRPGFRVTENLDSNPALGGLRGTSLRGYTNLGAELQFVQFWPSNSEFRYSGAVRYNSDSMAQVDQHFNNSQDVSLVKQFLGRRYKVILADQADYTLYSNFAGAGMEGMGDIGTQVDQLSGLVGIQLPTISLQQQYLPNQTVLTQRASRISNVALGEWDYRTSRRSTITATASYGLLQFPSAGLIDSNQSLLSLGYNYQRSQKDMVALEYDFGYFRFPGADDQMRTHSVLVKYSRRLTGRLSAEGGVGPQVSLQHVLGQGHSTATWQGEGTVQYRQGKLTANAAASRLLSNGGGVSYGAETESVQGGLAYEFSRRLTSSFNFGVSHNRDLLTGQTISLEFANITMSRRLGRYATVFANYYVAHQVLNQACSGITCEPAGTRQVGGIGVSWNYRPVPINF